MKRILIILAIIISTKIIYATPMVDVTAKGGAFGATLSINHDCVAADTMLLVACASYNQAVTSLSWRGKALTSITATNSQAKYYSVWGLLSPGAGKGNLTVTATSAYCITAISQSLSWAFAYTGQGVENSITHTAQSINLPDTLFIPVCGTNIYDGFTAPAGQTTPVYTGLSNTAQSLGLTEYSPTYSGAFNTYIYTTSTTQYIAGQLPVIISGNTLTPTTTPIPAIATCTAVLSATVITGMATIQASMTPYLTETPQTIPANPTANATIPALATAIQSITPYTPPTPVSTCTAVMSATVITGMATVVSSLTPYVTPPVIAAYLYMATPAVTLVSGNSYSLFFYGSVSNSSSPTFNDKEDPRSLTFLSSVPTPTNYSSDGVYNYHNYTETNGYFEVTITAKYISPDSYGYYGVIKDNLNTVATIQYFPNIVTATSTITPTTTQTNVPNATYTVTNSPTSTNTATITATYIPAMALNLGNTNTVWADGVTWTADNNLSNWTVTGGILGNHYPISNTSFQNVFGYNRYSATDITITTTVLTGVRYLITMDFATYINSYRDLQDISCNGVMIYPALDVYGTVGVYSALTKQFYAYPNNAGFSFNFHTVSGNTGSFINGIRLDQSGLTNTPTISQTATKTNTVTVSPTVTATITMTWTVTSTPTVNVNIFRINAGNQSTTTTAYGVSWNIDTPYNSSYGYVNNHIIHSVTYTVKGTNYQTLYGKWATTSNTNLEYQFNCSSATYRITLKFTDFISTAKAQNIQSVYINNALISNMNSLDIYSLVGNGTALDYVIYYQFTNIGSPLVLDLRKVTGGQFINALSVEAVNPAIISAQHIQLNKGYSSLIQTP